MNERLNSVYHFIINRVQTTIATQNIIADKWVWDELDVPGWQAKLDTLENPETGLRFAVLRADGAEGGARAGWDVTLSELHEETVTGVGAARVRWRRQRPEREIVAALSARAQDRAGRFDEAEAFAIAWEELEPAWEPVPGMTLAAFSAKVELARTNRRETLLLELRRRRAEGRLMVAAAELEELAQAWYAVATSIFSGTSDATRAVAELLANIPTTYTLAKRRRGRPGKMDAEPDAPAEPS
jgi:hypothetical protein